MYFILFHINSYNLACNIASENIGNLLPENSHHLHIEKQPDDSRKLTLEIYEK